jgi:hypothetical protein
VADKRPPRRGQVYERISDGKRFMYVGRGDVEFTRGWEALGPDVFGLILGEPWEWPIGYRLVAPSPTENGEP